LNFAVQQAQPPPAAPPANKKTSRRGAYLAPAIFTGVAYGADDTQIVAASSDRKVCTSVGYCLGSCFIPNFFHAHDAYACKAHP
jgi:hypothetical protein